MNLKRSYAYRLSSDIGRDVSLGVDKHPSIETGKPFVNLMFDIGTEKKHEPVMVRISPADFPQIAAVMFAADREAAIRAFATAILAEG